MDAPLANEIMEVLSKDPVSWILARGRAYGIRLIVTDETYKALEQLTTHRNKNFVLQNVSKE